MLLPSGRCASVRMFRAVKQGARPVPGLEEAEDSAADEQPAELARARVGRVAECLGDRLGQTREWRRQPGQRPADQDGRVEPPRADAVGDEAEEDAAGRERVAEPLFEVPVPAVVEADLGLELRGGQRKRLPVHVVEHGGEQKRPADPPLPRRGREADSCVPLPAVPGDDPVEKRDDRLRERLEQAPRPSRPWRIAGSRCGRGRCGPA